MPRDPRIDAYIDGAADFAKPILTHLREAVHAACPEIQEAVKWGMPAFVYKGESLAGMAAFKAHATFGFWHRNEIESAPRKAGEAMGQFGRIASIGDLPDDAALRTMIAEAMALIDSGAKVRRAKTAPKPEIAMPDDLRDALAATEGAAARFDAFPPGARRDYLEWITEAKRPETRAKRIAEAVPWIAEGKKRHWKYEGC